MEKVKILSEEEIKKEFEKLPAGWELKDSKISKQFEFADFVDCLDFINKLAPFCEEMDHHPDIHIFYSKILFELQRFDVGGKLTDKDFIVAEEIERLYAAK